MSSGPPYLDSYLAPARLDNRDREEKRAGTLSAPALPYHLQCRWCRWHYYGIVIGSLRTTVPVGDPRCTNSVALVNSTSVTVAVHFEFGQAELSTVGVTV